MFIYEQQKSKAYWKAQYFTGLAYNYTLYTLYGSFQRATLKDESRMRDEYSNAACSSVM